MTDVSEQSVAEVLNLAADLLEKPGAWTQGAFSRNADGSCDADEDEITASEPVCWCTMGAIAKVTHADPLGLYVWSLDSPTAAAYKALRPLVSYVGSGDVADWNDAPERTQAEVVAALRAKAASLLAAPRAGEV